jgi:hypothetical protein
MYNEHPSFNPPTDPKASLWRYMDLAKFLALLEDEALYFAVAANMSDKFEGALSHANLAQRKLLATSPDYKGWASMESLVPAPHAQLATRYTYLNCWYESEHESAAMWGLYQSEGRGIAIRSSFLRLTQCFKTDRLIYVGEVKYIDYSRTPIPTGNMFDAFMHKRLSFEHEHEVRAVTADQVTAREIWQRTSHAYGPGDTVPHPLDMPADYPAGLNIPINLAGLVEAVYISPEAASWFAKLVEKLIHRYGYTWPIHYSDLGKDPVY